MESIFNKLKQDVREKLKDLKQLLLLKENVVLYEQKRYQFSR